MEGFPSLQFYVNRNASINFLGTGLTATLIEQKYIWWYDTYMSLYVLSGNLLDGTDITGNIIAVENIGINENFHLINPHSKITIAPNTVDFGMVFLDQQKQKRYTI